MKKIIGIVSEYNPFHAGHAYHIRSSRQAAGAEEDSVVICVMSGDFVQRGEWAIQPKSMRAESAVKNGADIVFEIPLPWCLSSAGIYASAGVEMLLSLGMTHLSFGSESGDLSALRHAAQMMEASDFDRSVAEAVREDPRLTYPAAMSRMIGNDVLSTPNDLLAVAYLRELYKAEREFGRHTEAICIQRQGSRHDAAETDLADNALPSASQIRSAVYTGRIEMPHPDRQSLSIAALSRLRMYPKEYFSTLPGCANGLGNRIYDAVRESSDLEEIFDKAKTRAYTHSRVRRSVMCAVLGVREGDNKGMPPYARILAMNHRGMAYLASEKENQPIKILNRPKEVSFTDEHAQHIFDLGSAAHDFYMLGFPTENNYICGEDYRNVPIVVQDAQNTL